MPNYMNITILTLRDMTTNKKFVQSFVSTPAIKLFTDVQIGKNHIVDQVRKKYVKANKVPLTLR